MQQFDLPKWAWMLIVVAWLGSGLAAAWFHTQKIGDVDNTTLGFLAFGFSAAFLFIISKITLPGNISIEVRTQVTQTASDLATNYAKLVSAHAHIAARLVALEGRALRVLRHPALTREGAQTFARQTCTDALTHAVPYIAPNEDARILIWRCDASLGTDGALVVQFGAKSDAAGVATAIIDQPLTKLQEHGIPITDTDYVPTAFRLRNVGNYADAPKEFRAPDADDYHGLLLIPIVVPDANRVYGVLEIDRQDSLEFDERGQTLALALAGFLGTILTDPAVGF